METPISTTILLDRVREKLQITSDYQLARELQVSRQQISNYRAHRSTFSNEVAQRVAEILGMPYAVVLTVADIERAGRGAEKEARLSLLRALRGTSEYFVFAALAVGAATLGAPTPAQAAPASTLHNVNSEYALRRKGRFAATLRLLGLLP